MNCLYQTSPPQLLKPDRSLRSSSEKWIPFAPTMLCHAHLKSLRQIAGVQICEGVACEVQVHHSGVIFERLPQRLRTNASQLVSGQILPKGKTENDLSAKQTIGHTCVHEDKTRLFSSNTPCKEQNRARKRLMNWTQNTQVSAFSIVGLLPFQMIFQFPLGQYPSSV